MRVWIKIKLMISGYSAVGDKGHVGVVRCARELSACIGLGIDVMLFEMEEEGVAAMEQVVTQLHL